MVTVARSDYGIYQPLLRAIEADPDLALALYVGGMHLSPEFGRTVEAIQSDGYPIAARVEMTLSSDTAEGVAKSMGLGLLGFGQAYAHVRPDILVVLGDRFEMYTAALAALPFNLPVAHLHGGELTQGAMDDALRHSLTKLSHLHFVATATYARRVLQLGEEPWRVTLCGALSLDHLATTPLLSPAEIATRFGLDLPERFLLATLHPETLSAQPVESLAEAYLAALAAAGLPVVFTLPNADAGGRTILRMTEQFLVAHPHSRLVPNLGMQGYFSLMARAAAMVGNSSSGLLEAPSFALPVVNVGGRQQGRVRVANVIDVDAHQDAILNGIRLALSPGFRAKLQDLVNPYGDGHAAGRIVAVLKATALDHRLIAKAFHDVAPPADEP